jgi:hypothetical protein
MSKIMFLRERTAGSIATTPHLITGRGTLRKVGKKHSGTRDFRVRAGNWIGKGLHGASASSGLTTFALPVLSELSVKQHDRSIADRNTAAEAPRAGKAGISLNNGFVKLDPTDAFY